MLVTIPTATSGTPTLGTSALRQTFFPLVLGVISPHVDISINQDNSLTLVGSYFTCYFLAGTFIKDKTT